MGRERKRRMRHQEKGDKKCKVEERENSSVWKSDLYKIPNGTRTTCRQLRQSERWSQHPSPLAGTHRHLYPLLLHLHL